jgi:glycosyltransferase involved in cell wall biosynthesis
VAVKVFTLATQAMLPQARALARSLASYEPGWPFEILLIGRDERADVVERSPRARSILSELDLDLEALLTRHDAHDLSLLLLPRLLKEYGKSDAGPVLHLPPTAWVIGDLEPIETALSTRSVLLTARMTADLPKDGLQPTREQMELAGRMSETIIGVDGTSGADGFLTWWAGWVEQTLGSLDGLRRGARPEDRPWLPRLLELAPARFSTAVLDDPGWNLNLWNLHERSLESTADGLLVDGAWPARFLDLPGFEPNRPHRLSALASRVRISRSPVLRELCVEYATELEQTGWRELDRRDDVGRRLANGLVYDDALRSLHMLAEGLGADYEDLFAEEGSRMFTAWLEAPAATGGEHGISRYVFYRVAHERPDVMRAYPQLDGPDGAEYVAWCWAFGREEMAIPDRFMPPRPGARVAGNSRAPDFDGRQDAEPAGPRGRPGRLAPKPNGRPQAPRSSTREEPALAVRVTGYLGHSLGLGAAARGYARALGAAGVPVSTVSVPLHHLELPVELEAGYGRHAFEDVAHGHGRNNIEIVAVNADELPGFVNHLGVDYFQGLRIGIWGWETNSIPPRWRHAFGLVDEIWVYSRFMAENIGAVAPVPVMVLPPPVQPPTQPAKPLRLGLSEDDFLFLFVFDYLSTIQRKNPVGLIEAFKRAFTPGEGPRLLIKTINAPLRPLAEEEVLWAAHERPDIHVIDRSLSGAERDGLMAGCDCYVSLHRSEGFGLTLAEAMAIGKPVIGTGYSGNTDFMNAENSYLVDHEIGRVGPDCEIYPADGEWAEPSVEHAAALMRRVFSEPEEAARIGERAHEDVAGTLSSQATGAAMRRRLEELVGPGPHMDRLATSAHGSL